MGAEGIIASSNLAVPIGYRAIVKECAAVLCSFALLVFTSCASPRAWTKSEKLAAGWFVTGHFADYYTTESLLNDPRYYEKNPILGEHPSDGKLILYFSITGIAALGIAHFWPDTRHWILWPYGGAGFYWANHNRKLD